MMIWVEIGWGQVLNHPESFFLVRKNVIRVKRVAYVVDLCVRSLAEIGF